MPSMGRMGNGGFWILDLIFRDNALIMTDSQLLINAAGAAFGKSWNIGASIPLPIIGFSFDTPEQLNLLNYSYTEYPMLNKVNVVNSFIKGTGSIRLRGMRPITRGNSIVLNYLMNKALVLLIEKYADLGGTWTINTLWGTYGNLVLESLDGVVGGEKAGGGTAFDFTFKRVNFDAIQNRKKGVAKVVSKLLS